MNVDDTQKNNIFQVKDLVNNKIIRLYHGNKDKNMVPDFSFNNSNNDYGKGFYTTPDKELGKEWAYSKYTKGKEGYLFTYEIDITSLEILDLTSLDSMHWIAELLANRQLNINNREALQDTIDEVIKLFKLDTSIYDIIIGYRADDSYFTYARDFVSGLIYRETVENALRLGNLGIQVFIKSQKAFDRLKQIGEPVAVDSEYRDKYIDRDNSAASQYRISRTDNSTSKIKETILDIIKKRRDELNEQ